MAFTFLPRSRRMALLASTAIGIVLFGAPLAPARANPNGGTVVGGGATIDSAPGSVTVRQTTNRAVIDWQDFSIGNGESTTFEQPGRSSVTLNRVTGDNASTIDGKLTANGNVFLINRNGVLFGAGAQVDVGGLVATTSDIDNDAFMAGGNRFDRPTDNPDARVVNEGRITLADKGIAALVGPSVANNGVIAARLGTVALAGAETFTVDLAGDGLISFDTGQTVDRAGGTPQVANSGTIAAAGGTVILNARQAAGVVDRAIDMTGVIEVGGVAVEGGTVILSGGDGTTHVSGTIAASGVKGGTVEITGRDVALAGGARIDATGARGGGTVNIGGGLRGQGPTKRAETTRVEAGARIDASATGDGDGGTIVVWSDKATDFAGSARATGGAGGGDGGLIETSSMGRLDVSGARIDASAPAGKGGEWLLDPADIAIVNRGTAIPPDGVFIPADTSTISIESIFDVLKTGTNVSIVTNDPALKGDGNISYLAAAGYDLGGVSANLRLEAAGAIDWSGTLEVSNGTLGIDAQAGRGILWSGTLDGSAAALTLKATAGGSMKIFDGKLIADTIDLRGCTTGAGGCGTDADPYGIGIQPTAGGSSGIAPSIEIKADQLTLLGGLGGIGIDHGEDANSSMNIAVGRNLHMQGYGYDPFHVGNGIFSPAATATALITGAFRNSDLGALVGAPAGSDVPGLSDIEMLALGGFQSLTLRTGAASSTFDADEASGTASVLVGSAVPGGASIDLPFDVFVEANDGGDFFLAPDVAIIGGGNLSITTSGASASAALLGATTLSGDLTINSAHIVLANDLDIGGTIQLDGNVAINAGVITMKAGGDLNITGTLDGFMDFSTPTHPDVTLSATSGLVRIGGDAGFGVGLASLSITAGSIELAGVSTSGDQRYEATAINLLGRGGAGIDYISAAGDITVMGRTWLSGDIAMTASDGDIRFSRDILRASAADTASLALSAGEVVVGGDIGNTEGLLDRLSVSATRAFTLHDARTSGDQTYAAPLGRFFGETYWATEGDIDAGATENALISGTTRFEAGRGASFDRIDAVSEGDAALTVIAHGGDIGFSGNIGRDTRLGSLSASATGTIAAADLYTTGNIDLTATDIRFTGINSVAGGDFVASGRMTIDRDMTITGGTLVLLDGDIDLASAGNAGLSIVTEAGNAILLGDVGGTAALGYLDITARDGIRLGNVRTTGDQRYVAAATGLRGSSYITDSDFTIVGETTIKDSVGVFAGGDIDIGDRLDVDELSPPEAVTRFEASADGSLTIAGPIGGLSPLGSLDLRAVGDVAVGAIDVTGALRMRAGSLIHLLDSHVQAGTTIDMAGDVRLRYDTEIAAGGDVTIIGPIDADGESDGIPSLDITSDMGAVRVDGAIGTRSGMLDIRVTAADTITLGDVSSQGSQNHDGPVIYLEGTTYEAGRRFTVTGDTVIARDTRVHAGSNLTFAGRIDAATPGEGGRSPAPSLVAESDGALTVGGDIGGQRILGDVDLSAAGDLLVHSVAATGAISITAGALLRLADSTLDAGTDITLSGAVYLLGDALMRAGNAVRVEGTIDAELASSDRGFGELSAVPAPNLDIEAATGDARIAGAIGAVAALRDVSIAAAGDLKIADVSADGSIGLVGAAITLEGGHYAAGGTFAARGPATMTRATTVSAAGDILFGGTIDLLPGLDGGDASPGAASAPVVLRSRGGGVTLEDEVGGGGRLGSLLVSAADEITITGGVASDGDQTYEAGRITFIEGTFDSRAADIIVGGNLDVMGSVALSAGRDIETRGTIDSRTAEGIGLADVSMTAGRDIRVLGPVGRTVPLGSFILEAETSIDPPSVTTRGPQSYRAPVIVLTGSRYETQGGSFTTIGSLDLTAPSVLIDTTDYSIGGDITLDGMASGRDVTLNAGSGAILGLEVDFDRLTVRGIGGTATMGGSIGDVSGEEAAADVLRPDGIDSEYRFNDCVMATSCGGPPPPPPPPPGGIDPEGVIRIELPPVLGLPTLAPTPLLLTATEDPTGDPRFEFSNTGKDALWRLDLLTPDDNGEIPR